MPLNSRPLGVIQLLRNLGSIAASLVLLLLAGTRLAAVRGDTGRALLRRHAALGQLGRRLALLGRWRLLAVALLRRRVAALRDLASRLSVATSRRGWAADRRVLLRARRGESGRAAARATVLGRVVTRARARRRRAASRAVAARRRRAASRAMTASWRGATSRAAKMRFRLGRSIGSAGLTCGRRALRR